MLKEFFFVLLCVLYISTAHSTTYYFSSSTGDDNRTDVQAQSAATPWKTLDKLNTIFYTLQPGDSLLLKRGDVFNGYIDIPVSGTAAFPVVVSAYGTGDKPVINGFTTLSNWAAVGNNVWEANCASCGATVNAVSINGAKQHMGRYPNPSASNGGYLTLESHGTNKIIDNELPASPVWSNAEVVIRKTRWITDRHRISNHTGNTITYLPNPSSNLVPADRFGYFIQNHRSTLDEDGEWYYDSAVKKMVLYYSGNPNTLDVKAASADLLVTCYDQSNVVIDGLAMVGANVEAMELYNATALQVKNCSMVISGYDGIYAENLNGFILQNCTISDANSDAVYLANNCSNSTINNNKISRTAIYPGSGYSGYSSYQGITVFGDNNRIEQNEVDSTGYSAIAFLGSNNLVKNNFTNYFVFVKDDGAGIYTHGAEIGGVPITGRKITENIVLNGIGAPLGTDDTAYRPVEGIYLDDKSKDVVITGNTVAYCNESGILVHNSSDVTIRNNTLFDNFRQWYLVHDSNAVAFPVRNLDAKGNILFARSSTKLLSRVSTIENNVLQFGKIDSNYYCNPADQNRTILVKYFDTTLGHSLSQFNSLSTWRSRYGYDSASIIPPAGPTDPILFEYNASASTKTIPLNGRYRDMRNNQLSGVYNLAPYASVILIKKASNCNTSTWKGTSDNSWHNPLNWSCGWVPDELTDVTIPASTPRNCVISHPAICHSLTVATGAVITSNDELEVKH